MTDDLYYRKLESMSTTDLVDMIRERDGCIAEFEKETHNLYLDKTELEDILEAIKCYFMCDMSVQCVEMQEEEHERGKRIKNLSEKIKLMLSKIKE